MATIRQRAQSIEPGVRVELFDADFTGKGGSVLRWHPHTQGGSGTLSWQSHVYAAYPVKAEGYEYKSGGVLPRPHLFLSNIDGTISALCRLYDDCLDVKITRHVTFMEFLDGQSGADPTQEYPPDIFFVERKVSESNTEVEFELVSAADFENVQLPRRQIIANTCPWVYRGVECGYSGPPKSDEFGTPFSTLLPGVTLVDKGLYNAATIYQKGWYVYVMVNGIRQYYVSITNTNSSPLNVITKWVRDWCAKGLSDCKVRFGANAALPYGGFPGTSKLP